MSDKHSTVLSILPFFHSLSVEDRQALARHSQLKEYPKKKLLFKTGEAAEKLHIAVSGRIKLFFEDAAGHQTILRVASRGDVLELIPLFENAAGHQWSAETVTPVTLLEISLNAARSRLGTPSSFMSLMLKALRNDMLAYVEARKILVKPAAKRVAWLLLQISKDMDGDGGTFEFPYDKGLAAAELCMTAETFSRSLAQLGKAGVKYKNNTISIENFGRLRKFVHDGKNRHADPRRRKK